MTATRKTWPRPATLGADLDKLHDELLAALDALLDVSAIEERFSRDLPVITPHPWKWARLGDDGIPLLSGARRLVDEWLESGARIIRPCAPEFLDDFGGGIDRLQSVIDRSNRGEGPTSSKIDEVKRHLREALKDQREALRHAGSDPPRPGNSC